MLIFSYTRFTGKVSVESCKIFGIARNLKVKLAVVSMWLKFAQNGHS